MQRKDADTSSFVCQVEVLMVSLNNQNPDVKKPYGHFPGALQAASAGAKLEASPKVVQPSHWTAPLSRVGCC